MINIAIQGHPTRGKEVTQILENLRGKNKIGIFGNNSLVYYYIDYNNNNLISCK